MSTYGYIIVKTLITKVEPDAEVKQSMNEINAAQRKRVAAQELAEADKIKIVTAAEAEAEKDRLHRGWYCRATEGHCRWIGRLY